MSEFKPLTPKYPHFLHGGDYNPEQWQDSPEILDKDIELLKKANVNVCSVGIFSWAALEPEKDKFTFEWLDETIDRLYKNGIYVVLATPSGARPQWLAEEYPEVLRVEENGVRNLFGGRHNHCFTSPAYRERVRIIDTKLAERYSHHPAVILWHISNELSGECHCELCQAKFREWCKARYGTLDNLNNAWWARFWSHTYTSWEQIHSPSSRGERSIHGLNIDWRRFVTDMTTDFMSAEIDAVKAVNPEIPVTANLMFMTTYGVDYFKLSKKLDVVSWDSYPEWHMPGRNVEIARDESLSHDMMRSLKGRSFLLMECTPSTTNWRPVSKLKKPGMHKLSVLNAVAHGSDSGMYFQMRQSRGSVEKFHSAVISHIGTDNTRAFKEISETGAALHKLSDAVYGASNPAKVAIIFDTESVWALDDCQGPRNCGLDFFGEMRKHYEYFWQNGINVDVLDCDGDFSGYSLVIAPMLYMYRGGIQEKLRSFVKNGGTLVTTALSGTANESDLCFLGEAADEKLSDVLGLWVEETDALFDGETNSMTYAGRTVEITQLCELVRPTTCEILSTYDKDFYAGMPTLTVNKFGSGTAYRLCAVTDLQFCRDFYKNLDGELKLDRAINTDVPYGVSLTYRVNDGEKIVFVQNFSDENKVITLDGKYLDLLNDEEQEGTLNVGGFGCRVIKKR